MKFFKILPAILLLLFSMSGCLITDDSLDPEILAAFERERNNMTDEDDPNEGKFAPHVTLTKVETFNFMIKMTAKVIPNGRKLSEVGFVWKTSYGNIPISDPTYSNNTGCIKLTLSQDNTFYGETKETMPYVVVRAYVKDSSGNIYYSECEKVMP